MANIRVDLDYTIQNGMDIVFDAPCDCSEVTGLIIYYPQSDGAITSKIFTFRDAHKNDLSDFAELFVSGARIKVNIDITDSYAYIQNADTNAYLEGRFNEKAPKVHNHSASSITNGTLPIARGGTGGTTAEAARNKLEITPKNIGALPATVIEEEGKPDTWRIKDVENLYATRVDSTYIHAGSSGLYSDGNITSDGLLTAKSGVTMLGNLTLDGYLILTRGKNWGTEDEIPTDVPDGTIFLKVVE